MQKFMLIIRILIAIVVGGLILRFVFGNGKPDAADKLVGLILMIGYGALLFALFGLSTLRSLGDRVARIYEPSDKHFRIMPEYSKAEARLKVGNYAAAVEEYRLVTEQFPDDIYAHVQIAQISADHLNDLPTAEAEFQTACAKAVSEDAAVLAHNRFADLYQFKLQNPARAVAIMEELRVRLPGTKAAERAEERIASLKVILGGVMPAKLPAKIAFRKMDEETRQQRRGY